jgi:hypothetical protein
MALFLRTAAAAAVVFVAAGLSPASADPYPWCAVYGGNSGGSSNCGFVSIEQCRATVSGTGGTCEPNQFYDGKPVGEAKPTKRPAKR